jgi:diguanylate cyclase (GGDEF)-like protein
VYPMLQFQQTMVDRQDAQVFDAQSAPRLPAHDLIPGGIPRDGKPWLVNVIPLFFEQEHFGFAVFEIGNTTRADAFEIVNSHLTSIIQGFRLLEETRNYTRKLEQDVAARTADLQSKNREIEQLNDELMRKNRTDMLTNLYTRGAVFDFLKRHFSGARRLRMRELNNLGNRRTGPNGQTFSVLMCDVDHFKRINDTHGHLVGDQVLRTIGELMNTSRMLRQEDIAGRFGGEEFIVVLTNTDAHGARQPASRFMDLLKAHTFKGKNDEPFHVTVSIGISELQDGDAGEEAVIQRADQALYYAKNHGRNRVVVYEDIGVVKNLNTK